MLLQTATTDKIQVITGQAITVDVHASYMDMTTADPPVVKGSTSGRTNTAISTATTTDVVAAPAASTIRNVKTLHIRNKHASSSVDVTVQYNQNGTLIELHKATLLAGQMLEYIEGVGFFVAGNVNPSTRNFSTADQGPGLAADTYITGSAISIPTGMPLAGTLYHLIFDVIKTAAGTATPIINLRFGTNGSTADTSRGTFTFGAGSAAIDIGLFEVWALFRSVGTGAAAVIESNCSLVNQLGATGLSTALKDTQQTSAGFDSTVANSIIGVSYNGGASASHTIKLARAELV